MKSRRVLPFPFQATVLASLAHAEIPQERVAPGPLQKTVRSGRPRVLEDLSLTPECT